MRETVEGLVVNVRDWTQKSIKTTDNFATVRREPLTDGQIHNHFYDAIYDGRDVSQLYYGSVARPTNRLSARTVVSIVKPGRHADGGGLYLHVESPELKRWVFVYQWERKRREMGLGKVGIVSLAEAREAALTARKLVYAGVNPMEQRRDAKITTDKVTFGQVAKRVLRTVEGELSNEKHLGQWKRSLEVHAAELTSKPVDQITTADVLEVLQPIWAKTPESASRTRGRIERVLDAAKAEGSRSGENPARWRGHLSLLLPKRARLTKGHHPAMPFADIAEFMKALRGRPAMAARALEFTILTAARTGETIGARWNEIDLDREIWTIPAERMKARSEHRVPLSASAVEVLRGAAPRPSTAGLEASSAQNAVFWAGAPTAFVFPGNDLDRPLSNMAMDMLLRRMGSGEWTVHGFRSTFRDWAGETTEFAREVIEAALAHAVGNAVERAYRRGDALERRRQLMMEWAKYCGANG